MECMCTRTRSRCILSSERVFGNGFRIRVNSKGKIPSTSIWVRSVSSSYREATSRKIPSTENQEGRTHDTVSCRTVNPTHFSLSYSGPQGKIDVCLCVCVCVCFYTLGQSWSLLSPLSYVRHTSSSLSLFASSISV